jgi:hypothetical protein
MFIEHRARKEIKFTINAAAESGSSQTCLQDQIRAISNELLNPTIIYSTIPNWVIKLSETPIIKIREIGQELQCLGKFNHFLGWHAANLELFVFAWSGGLV